MEDSSTDDLGFLTESLERKLQDFEKFRDTFESEVFRLKEEMHKMIDAVFETIGSQAAPVISETDTILEDEIKEFRRLSTLKKEISLGLRKITPLLEEFRRQITEGF